MSKINKKGVKAFVILQAIYFDSVHVTEVLTWFVVSPWLHEEQSGDLARF